MSLDHTINELVGCVVNFRDERGWKDGHSPENLSKSITIEASELLELFQWHPPHIEELQDNLEIRERVAEELADVLIYSFSLADRINLDVWDIVLKKLEKNAKKYPLSPSSD